MKRTQAEDRMAQSLAATHEAINSRHEETRSRLIERLEKTSLTENQTPTISSWRYAISGLSLTAVVTGVFLAVWFSSSISPAVAMERMAAAFERVNAYSYQMDSFDRSQKHQGSIIHHVTRGVWRTDPIGLRATAYIEETIGTNTENPTELKTLVNLEESYQAGKQGILINHLKKKYWVIDQVLTAKSMPSDSPQVAVFMVQQSRWRVVRDLGEKIVNGRQARGLEVILNNSQPISELGKTISEDDPDNTLDWRNNKIEVWIDPKTDLPIEFYSNRTEASVGRSYRFTDLQWNISLPNNTFDLKPPLGYKKMTGMP